MAQEHTVYEKECELTVRPEGVEVTGRLFSTSPWPDPYWQIVEYTERMRRFSISPALTNAATSASMSI